MPMAARLRRCLLALALVMAGVANGQAQTTDRWLQVIRDSPYWVSKGAFGNLQTIRRWVLNGESFCEVKSRHILFDTSATFLGYLNDAQTPEATQAKLNWERAKLFENQRVQSWLAGDKGSAGYPFALSCDQPDAQLAIALARYFGDDEGAKLWGTWDGMRIGARDDQVSLHEAMAKVYDDRARKSRITLPKEILATLAGKTLIESGGQKIARSEANARGIMQLSPAALRDCGLDEQFYFHRMAQIDCALKLMEQNHRNLKPVFDRVFAGMPPGKAQQLYALLLIQAYHGGVGRVTRLLNDPEVDQATRFFARNHRHFSAGDIALGIVFHNLGREQLGFASLYYLADTAVATELACTVDPEIPGCG